MVKKDETWDGKLNHLCFRVSCAVFLSPLLFFFLSFFLFLLHLQWVYFCCHSTSSCCSRPSNSIKLTDLPAVYTHNTRSKHDHSISVYIPSLLRLRALGHQNCFNLFEVEVIRIAEQVQIQPYSTMELNISEERELSCRINSKSILFWVTWSARKHSHKHSANRFCFLQQKSWPYKVCAQPCKLLNICECPASVTIKNIYSSSVNRKFELGYNHEQN